MELEIPAPIPPIRELTDVKLLRADWTARAFPMIGHLRARIWRFDILPPAMPGLRGTMEVEVLKARRADGEVFLRKGQTERD